MDVQNTSCIIRATFARWSYGNCSSGPAREFEIYDNTFTYTFSPHTKTAIKLRGGTGVLYNNKVVTRGFGITTVEL